MGIYSNILVAYDGSENSKRALEKAKQIAMLDDKSKITILTVWDFPNGMSSFKSEAFHLYDEIIKIQKDEAIKILSKAEGEVAEIKERCHFTQVQGHPAQSVVDFAGDDDIDLIVVGSRGLSGLKKLFLGSVSNHIVQDAPCAVLIVKQ